LGSEAERKDEFDLRWSLSSVVQVLRWLPIAEKPSFVLDEDASVASAQVIIQIAGF
jgi:hypothetical protein